MEDDTTNAPVMAEADENFARYAETMGGRMRINWDSRVEMSTNAHHVLFSEFLSLSGLFDHLVETAPLVYTSPNRPEKRDVIEPSASVLPARPASAAPAKCRAVAAPSATDLELLERLESLASSPTNGQLLPHFFTFPSYFFLSPYGGGSLWEGDCPPPFQIFQALPPTRFHQPTANNQQPPSPTFSEEIRPLFAFDFTLQLTKGNPSAVDLGLSP